MQVFFYVFVLHTVYSVMLHYVYCVVLHCVLCCVASLPLFANLIL